MKQGWEIKKLGEVCEKISRGISPKYIEKHGIIVLNQKCVRDHKINFEPSRRHDAVNKNVSADKYIRIGDVLVNSTGEGTLGRVAQVRDLPSEKVTVDSHISIVRPLKDNFFLDFFGWAMIFIENEIANSGAGASGQTELARTVLENNFSLVYPKSIPEQKNIVAILDEVFASIEKAKANAEQNLKNAKELFESYLQGVFENKGEGWEEKAIDEIIESNIIGLTRNSAEQRSDYEYKYVKMNNITRDNRFDLTKYTCVNATKSEAEKYSLSKGDFLFNTRNSYELVGKTCLFEGSEDEVILYNNNIMRIRFIKTINPHFINYSFTTKEIIKKLDRLKSGTTNVSAIYYKDLKNLKLLIPPLNQQKVIIKKLDALSAEVKRLDVIYNQKIKDLEELKKSVLQKAFSGELKAKNSPKIAIAKVISLQKVEGISPTDLQVGITAVAFQKHIEINKQDAFGHVKAEKIVHLAEYILNIDLERNPVKDAAGPNDFPHAKKVESRATKAGFYSVAAKKGIGESGYSYSAGRSMNTIITKTQTCLGELGAKLAQLLTIVVPMKTQQAEIVATIYAAWNNLILKGSPFTDDDIVYEARENWREEKLKIEREKFVNALDWMKKNELFIPKGNGKIVLAK